MTGYRVIIILASFIPAIINVGIFIYAFYFLKKDKLITTFSFVAFTSAIWQISDTLLRLVDDIDTATLIYKELSFGALFLLPASVHFALLYTNKFNKKKSSYIVTLLYLPAIIFYLSNSLNLINGQLVLTDLWQYSYVPNGYIDFVINIWLGGLGIFTMILLVKHTLYTKKNDVSNFKSTYFITIGYIIPAVMGIITQIIFPEFLNIPELPLTTTFITFFSIAAIYSLRKYQLFDYTPFSIGEQIFDTLNENIIITDSNNIVRYVNKSFYDASGYDKKDILGLPKSNFFLNNQKNYDFKNIKDKNILNKNIELKLYHKNGELRDVLINRHPYINLRNKKIGTISLILDISILKDKENELLKSEKKLLLSQKIAGIGFLFWDLKTNNIKSSNVVKNIFGLDNNSKYLTPDLINEFVHPEDKDKVGEALKKAISNQEIYNIEHRIINQITKKIVWVRAQGELYYEDDEPIEFIGTIMDITNDKDFEKNQLIAMLSGEEKEKKRIAFELHDGIAQYLTAINMNLIGIKDDIPDDIIEHYNKVQQLVATTLRETRNISHNLIPKEMELGLEIALNHLSEQYKDKSSLKINVKFTNVDETKIPQFTRFNLYRISQEFVNNTYKYANASAININFTGKENKIFFTLIDNGIGFEIDKKARNGIGIKNITQRVKAIDGILNMESNSDKGTRFEIIIDKD